MFNKCVQTHEDTLSLKGQFTKNNYSFPTCYTDYRAFSYIQLLSSAFIQRDEEFMNN